MTRDQFEQSLTEPLVFWSSRTAEEIGNFLGPRVSTMVGFDQRNPYHCYDLFLHSLYTVENILNNTTILLKVAAFFHDIGKPSVAMEKQGRLVFYGHALKSAEIACSILEKMGYTPDEISEVCFYIKHHDDFISWTLPEEDFGQVNKFFTKITSDNLSRYIERIHKKIDEDDYHPDLESWKNLLELCYADTSAQAEIVFQNGMIIDTKMHSFQKVIALQNCLTTIDLRSTTCR